jgi:hypothetical protein
MKWNAWGDPAAAKPLSDGIRSLLKQALAVADSETIELAADQVRLRPSALEPADYDALVAIVGPEYCRVGGRDRLLHAGGKSTLDLLRRKDTVAQDAPDAVLLPGDDAVLAPEWVPWSERLRPGDLGPGDLLPTEADDLRLEPGWTGEPGEPDEVEEIDERVTPVSGAVTAGEAGPAGEAGAEAAGGTSVVTEVDGVTEVIVSGPSLSTIGAVANQLGLGRPRVLSRYGLHSAADRWEEQFGGKTPMAQAAPANCASCGFLVPIAGSLSQAFGVCANEFSPADGHLVSLGYGCGAHSEAAVMPKTPEPSPMVLDDLHDTDPMPLHPDRQSSVEDTEPSEDDLGHG